jgi:hypothetical protein
MVIVCQDDSSARSRGAHHAPDDLLRLSDMLQHKTGMHQIKSAPFLIAQRQLQGITAAPFDQIHFAGFLRLAPCFGQLMFVPFHSNHATPGPRGA